MAAPGYNPLPSAQSMSPLAVIIAQFEKMNGGQPLTPQQYQQAINMTNPQIQGAGNLGSGLFDAAKKEGLSYAKKEGKNYLKEAFGMGGSGTAASEVGGFTPAVTQSISPATEAMMGNGYFTPASNVMSVAPNATAAAPEALGAFDISGFGSAGNAFLPAAGAFGMYDVWKNKRGGARGIGQGAASGAAMGSYFGPWGTGIGAVLGGAYGAMQHKSTKDYQKERWGKLKDSGKASEQIYRMNHKEGDDSIYDEGPRKGEKWTFEGALEDTKKDGLGFAHSYGNYDTFDDWGSLTGPQMMAVTKELANQGLYKGDKGDIVITDKNKAKQIYDMVKTGGFKIPQVSHGGTPPEVPLPAQNVQMPTGARSNVLYSTAPQAFMIPKRSSTDSPGMKNGQRIPNAGRR